MDNQKAGVRINQNSFIQSGLILPTLMVSFGIPTLVPPDDPAWREAILAHSRRALDGILKAEGFLEGVSRA